MSERDGSGRNVLLAAGGTGGHLFPAFALAEELARRAIAVELATDMRGDRYGTGFPARAVHRISSATVAGRSPMALARTGWALSRGLAQSFGLIGRLRPMAVVGFGGYPSFPPLLAASLRGVPTILHEQNAVLGRANRMLSGRVTAIATSFASVKGLEGRAAAKAHFTGNPIRDAVLAVADQPYPRFAEGGQLRLLVFGGSQGARYFSEAVPPALARLGVAERGRVSVVQQAREEDAASVAAAYRECGISADVAPFFKDLPQRMADAHLVIARAGASSVAEIAAIGRPAILVPLPHALDNDQLQNATRLAESGGAWCIEQRLLGPERLASEIQGLLDRPDLLADVAAKAKAQGRLDAVQRLADLVEELARKA